MRMAARYMQRLAFLAVLTFALVATGFAHRLPSTDDVAVDAFVLAGGDLADLCADGKSDGHQNHRDCPACQMSGTADLPPVTSSVHDADLVFVAEVVAPRASRAVREVADPALGLRAPPLV